MLTTYLPYKITFLGSDRFDDEMWIKNPQVGDEVRTQTFPIGGTEGWVIVEVSEDTVKVKLNEST